MTAEEQAVARGLRDLAHAAEVSGESIKTLTRWAKTKPALFDVVLIGCFVTWEKRGLPIQ